MYFSLHIDFFLRMFALQILIKLWEIKLVGVVILRKNTLGFFVQREVVVYLFYTKIMKFFRFYMYEAYQKYCKISSQKTLY